MTKKIPYYFLLLVILHTAKATPVTSVGETTVVPRDSNDDVPSPGGVTTVLPILFEKQEEFEGPSPTGQPDGPDEGPGGPPPGVTEPSGVDEESDEDEEDSATSAPKVSSTTKRTKRPVNVAGNFNQEWAVVTGQKQEQQQQPQQQQQQQGALRQGSGSGEDDEDEELVTEKVVPSSTTTVKSTSFNQEWVAVTGNGTIEGAAAGGTDQVVKTSDKKPVKGAGVKVPVSTNTDFNKEWAIVTGENAIAQEQEKVAVTTTEGSGGAVTEQTNIVEEEDEEDSQEENQTQKVTVVTSASTKRPTNFNDTNFNKEWAVVTGEQVLSDGQARAACECGKVPFNVPGGGVNEWPWTAAIVKNGLFAGGRPHCGATLINSKYVVTAATCMDGLLPDRAEVWLTVHDNLQNTGASSGTLKLGVEKILMHPNYHRSSGENDIALVGLSESVPIGQNNYFVPACVPAGSNDYSGIMGKMAAWGTSTFGSSNNRIGNNRLCKADMPILSNDVCNRDSKHRGKITSNMLCAGLLTAKYDSNCVADAGGGLVISNGGRHTLVGVTSFGYTPNQSYSPTVHTRISAYPEWILHNTLDSDWCE